MYHPFQEKIALRTLRVAVVGLGYVGLPLAITFAEAGFHVTGIDVDQQKSNKQAEPKAIYLIFLVAHFERSSMQAASILQVITLFWMTSTLLVSVFPRHYGKPMILIFPTLSQ